MIRFFVATLFTISGSSFAQPALKKSDPKTTPQTVPAPNPNAPQLNLRESLTKGMDYSLEYKKARSFVKQVHQEYRLAESTIFPEISGIGSAFSNKNPAFNSGKAISGGSTEEDYRAYLKLRQPLYTGGALISGLSAAKTSEDAALQRLFEAKQSASYNIISAYLSAAETQVLLSLAQSNSSVLKGYFDITSRYAAIGRSKNIDRLQAEANYNLGLSEVLQKESDYETNLGELQKLMGEHLNPQTQLDTQLVLQPVETGTLNQLLDKALENNPKMRALQLDVEKQRYSNDVVMAKHKPSLALDGTWGYKSPDRPDLFESPSNMYTVGLTLTVPLFSGLSSVAERSRNAELVTQAEKDLAIYRDQVKQTLSISLTNLKRDFERLKLAQSAANSARRAMDAAMRDYRQGLVSSTDVLSVQRSRYDAESQYTRAQFSYQRQVLTMRNVLGIDLEKTYAAQ